jgi:saccharopine dehydrogenase-like NADP-dependent oxidoreductase
VQILLAGSGAVGSAIAAIAARRRFFDGLVVADLDEARARAVVDRVGDPRLSAVHVNAMDARAVAALARDCGATVLVNACDPRCNPSLFDAALDAGCTYIDMAATLSAPHPDRPYELTGVKLGDAQFAQHDRWVDAGRLAIVGMGVDPGLSDVFARYAADELFSSIDEIGVRDTSTIAVDGYDFAPTFSIWTTIEECLNPPVVYERERGWYTTPLFGESEVFDFPEGIGPVRCVDIEHEEVLLVPRELDVGKVTFKYGLDDTFLEVLRGIFAVGLHRTDPVRVGGVEVVPRDLVVALLPDPATLGDRMHGVTCVGTWVTGEAKDGSGARDVFLYNSVDHEWTMAEYGCQAIAWQTAMNPVIALELIATGAWSGAGVLVPESFPPRPFLDLLAAHGTTWHLLDR